MPALISAMGDGIVTVIKKIGKIEFDPKTEGRLKKFAELVTPVAQSMQLLLGAFTKLMDLGGGIIKGKEHIFKGSTLSVDFLDSVHQLVKNIVFLFTGESLGGGTYTRVGKTGLISGIQIIIDKMAGMKMPENGKLLNVSLMIQMAADISVL